jgi:hypothetical protein
MKVNIFGTGCKYWLVTPEFNVDQDLSFDLALTDYNNSDPIENDTLQADDRFIVLIYADNAWHILREWNNSGSSYVFNTISTTGENVTIGLSAYYGQDVKIAFYGESTASGGDNDLHIDNVICGIPYEAGEWETITVSDTTATITGLNPETDYEVKVQGDCGIEGLSLETAIVSFTTLEDCPVPQNVEVDDITHNSATVNWDGYNDSYIVSYRIPAHTDGIIENFDVSGVPTGWTRYTGLVEGALINPDTLTTATGGWQTTSYALGRYNMKVNIYGLGCKYWLVSPEFRPSQDLDFDLALTDYNNSDPIENDTLQADDRFVVLIYANDAWHILREWNNSGSEYVYNTISTTGENVTINLSAYYGQKVKIAFYGESTASGGDNDLHIDNIVCGVPVEAGEWETVEATESPVILTGLTPETPYEVKVQGFCNGEPTEETETVTFTTLEQTTVTQTINFPNTGSSSFWFSTYIEMDPVELLEAIEEALGEDGNEIKYKNAVTSWDEDEEEWSGSLQNIGLTNDKTYMIKTNAAVTVTLEGPASDPANYTITLAPKAWTWIGFPCGVEVDIEDAFANFVPVNEDQIKSKNATSAWDEEEEEWSGGVTKLVPGTGYMFYSAGTTTRTLIFSTGSTKGRGVNTMGQKTVINKTMGNQVIKHVSLIDKEKNQNNEKQNDQTRQMFKHK